MAENLPQTWGRRRRLRESPDTPLISLDMVRHAAAVGTGDLTI